MISFSAIKSFKAKVADERNREVEYNFPEVRVRGIMERI